MFLLTTSNMDHLHLQVQRSSPHGSKKRIEVNRQVLYAPPWENDPTFQFLCSPGGKGPNATHAGVENPHACCTLYLQYRTIAISRLRCTHSSTTQEKTNWALFPLPYGAHCLLSFAHQAIGQSFIYVYTSQQILLPRLGVLVGTPGSGG